MRGLNLGIPLKATTRWMVDFGSFHFSFPAYRTGKSKVLPFGKGKGLHATKRSSFPHWLEYSTGNEQANVSSESSGVSFFKYIYIYIYKKAVFFWVSGYLK